MFPLQTPFAKKMIGLIGVFREQVWEALKGDMTSGGNPEIRSHQSKPPAPIGMKRQFYPYFLLMRTPFLSFGWLNSKVPWPNLPYVSICASKARDVESYVWEPMWVVSPIFENPGGFVFLTWSPTTGRWVDWIVESSNRCKANPPGVIQATNKIGTGLLTLG